VGLLLLRLVLAMGVIGSGSERLMAGLGAADVWGGVVNAMVGVIVVAGGALTAIGYLTPLVASVVAFVGTGGLATRVWTLGSAAIVADGVHALMLEMAIAIALVMLGPGGYSVDALRFGRREIVIPPRISPDP